MAQRKTTPLQQTVCAGGDFIDVYVTSATSLRWSPRSSALLVCSKDGEVSLLCNEGTLLWKMQAHKRSLLHASWSHDSKKIATSGIDGSCKIWNASTGEALMVLSASEGWSEQLSWSPWLPVFVTASSNVIKVWTESGRVIEQFTDHSYPVTGLCWHPTLNDTFASCAADGVRLWKLGQRQPVHRLSCSEYPEKLAFNRNGTILAYGCNTSAIHTWTMGTGIVFKVPNSQKGTLVGLDWSWGGQWLAFGSSRQAYLWRFDAQCPRAAVPQKLSGYYGNLNQLQFHTYEQLLACTDEEGSTFVWRMDHESRVTPVCMLHNDFAVTAIAWSPLSRKLAISYANNSLRLWSNDFSIPGNQTGDFRRVN